MKLILTAAVNKVGVAGDIVDVKPGYGRNFLLPQGYAISWSKGAEKQILGIQRARDAREIRSIEHAQQVRAQLEALGVSLSARTGTDDGKLYGSITPADVESAWRLVVSNATQLFLPHLTSLSALQAQLLRHLARNPGVQPFSDTTLRAVGAANSAVHKALARLHELELVRIEENAGRKRVWIHDPRLAFYLRT